MTTTTQSAALVPIMPVFTNTDRLALAGFLAGYSGLTRQAYELDLRQYAPWCQHHQIHLFAARRAGIECFARDLEAHGRARATMTRRLCTIAGFHRYAVEEELLDHSPGSRLARRPAHHHALRPGPHLAGPARHLYRRRLRRRGGPVAARTFTSAWPETARRINGTNSDPPHAREPPLWTAASLALVTVRVVTEYSLWRRQTLNRLGGRVLRKSSV